MHHQDFHPYATNEQPGSTFSKFPPWPYTQQSSQPYPVTDVSQGSQMAPYSAGGVPGHPGQPVHSQMSQQIQPHLQTSSPSYPIPGTRRMSSESFDMQQGQLIPWSTSTSVQITRQPPALPLSSHDSLALTTRPPPLPVVNDAATSVLGQTQKLLSHAWRETSQRVHGELQSVHNKYSDLLRYEKNITEQAIETCKQLRAEADASEGARAKAEAGKSEAMAEVAKLRSENEVLQKKVSGVYHLAKKEIAILKKQIEHLLQQRKRLREEWGLSNTLRLKLHQENVALTSELRKNLKVEDCECSEPLCPTDGDDVKPALIDAPDVLQQQAEPSGLRMQSLSPALSDLETFWAENSSDIALDALSSRRNSTGSTNTDGFELQYPPSPYDTTDLPDDVPAFPSMELMHSLPDSDHDSSPLPGRFTTHIVAAQGVEDAAASRPLKRRRSLYDSQIEQLTKQDTM